MVKGVRVDWPDDEGNIVGSEYFYGIDVDRLDDIPEFTNVPSLWPLDGTWVVYTVNPCCDRDSPPVVRLVVTYDRTKNKALAEEWPNDIFWGTNTIVLARGKRQGHCKWLGNDGEESEVHWEAFEKNVAPGERPRYTYRGSKREAGFRDLILDCDDRRCVLTGETTIEALEAAHLIPAANGQNDEPWNGITLRADLHRLFDAGLFTLAPDDRVAKVAPQLSEAYRKRLRNRRLPRSTLGRVKATLTLDQFRNRPCAR